MISPPTLVLILLLLPGYRAEVFSSVEDMKSVFRLERNIVMELLNLADKLKSKLTRIQRLIILIRIVSNKIFSPNPIFQLKVYSKLLEHS